MHRDVQRTREIARGRGLSRAAVSCVCYRRAGMPAITSERKREIAAKFGAERARHRQHQGPDRAADRAHQPPHRAPARAEQGPPLPSRPADARRQTAPLPRLPAAPRPRGLPRAHQGARPAQVMSVASPPGTQRPSFTLARADGEELHRGGPARADAPSSSSTRSPSARSAPTSCSSTRSVAASSSTARRRRSTASPATRTWAQSGVQGEARASAIEQLSDFEPKGAACDGLRRAARGRLLRSARSSILDPDGVVRWSYQAPSPGELPSPDLLREGVAAAFAGRTRHAEGALRAPRHRARGTPRLADVVR